jgi:hypothetical protein
MILIYIIEIRDFGVRKKAIIYNGNKANNNNETLLFWAKK